MKNEQRMPLKSMTLAVAMSFVVAGCDRKADTPASTPEAEVSVVELVSAKLVLTTELPGRTTPFLIAEVRPQVGGILQKRFFEEGSEVKSGQVLYQIDPATYRTTLAKAEASLESAKLLSQRYDRLVVKNAISQQDKDDARSQYLQAKASVDSAKIDLGYTRITAPISGRIGRSSYTQGALLTANQTSSLATIQQLDPIYVDIVQSSTSILRLKDELANGKLKSLGNEQVAVQLQLENGKLYKYQGKLQFSEVSVDEGTGAVTLRAVFPNPEGILLPGMFVHAQLQEGVNDNALLVPQRGVTRDTDGQATALVVGKGDIAELRHIFVDRTVGTNWLVTDGLHAGDKVIVEGLQKVKPGAKIRVVSENSSSELTSQSLQTEQPAPKIMMNKSQEASPSSKENLNKGN